MAVRPGEENVATLFGDIHYFYGQETEKPRHHRFDKGSYVYLFENANDGRARIEIANHPGTDDQDDFDGFLDRVHVRYSYRQHCLVSLTVNDVPNQEEWHLPTYDPRNENIYHYKLHSLDIYFWTQRDALQFVNGIRRVLPPTQVEVLDEPGPPPRQQSSDMSSVVQKLERAALTDNQASRQPANGVPSFAPPPLSAVSADNEAEKPAFVPMAYNPAAPAAPETVRHREKTPPPEDASVSPLHQRLAADAATPFSPGLAPPGLGPSALGPLSPGVPPPGFHSPPGAPSFPAPPLHSVTSPGLPPPGFGHTHPGLARAATMPAHAMASPGLVSPFGAYPGSPGYVPQQQHQLSPTPPVSSPGLPPPPAPPGGFSSYSYAGQTAASGPGEYSVHQQMYQPTEGEASLRYKKAEARANRGQGQEGPRGRLEENAGRLERGVTGMFKKFEKKFG